MRFTDQVGDEHAGQADDRRHPAGRARSATGCCAGYDTLIIDEAHERSLNIDFILGYLAPAAAPPPRPQGDHHLGHHRSGAVRRALLAGPARRRRSSRCRPHLPGRGPLPADRRPRTTRTPTTDRDQLDAIGDAVDELRRRGPRRHPGVPPRRAGDPRHRRRAGASTSCRGTEILPLYARLSAAEQHRVFQPAHAAAGSCWRPTSPRPRSPCPASATSSTPAPRASPATRAGTRCSGCRSRRSPRPAPTSGPGRCGRVADGICIRLYAEEDFDARPAFTDPEILRTNLACGHPADDRARTWATSPRSRSSSRRTRARSTDGFALLHELGALERRSALTPIGRELARAAGRPAAGPHARRGRPQRLPARGAGHRGGAVDPGPARAARRRSARPPTRSTPGSPTEGSDFLAYLNLWRLPREAQASCPAAVPQVCAPSSSTTCASASGRTCTHSCARPPATRASPPNDAGRRTPSDPHRRALRPALPDRAARGRDARVPRRPRRPVHDLPGLAAGQEDPALGDGRRAGGDVAAVRPDRREDPAGVGRAAGRTSGQTDVFANRTGRASAPPRSRSSG